MNERIFPDDVLPHHRTEQPQLLLIGLVVLVVSVLPDELHVHPLGSNERERQRPGDLSQHLNISLLRSSADNLADTYPDRWRAHVRVELVSNPGQVF